ncbi:MAG: hypothetical protein ABI889_09665 [Gemmatimonadota bacterium]
MSVLRGDSLPADVREIGDDILAQARRVANVVKRLSQLEAPKTVEYLAGAPMLDLSERSSH